MICLEKIYKTYKPNVSALTNINLNIGSKEFVTIVGQSGTGKTTLARLLIAEESPSKGKITIGGWDITRIKDYEVPYLRRQIGVVFQDFKLLDKKTLYENVAFALEVSGASSKYIRDVVPHVLKLVGLEDKMHRYPKQVSGGEQQRTVIARSLVHRPKILIADEPTGNLDTINSDDIIKILTKINELGTTVILISHDPNIVNFLHRRVITIDKGRIVSDEKVGTYNLEKNSLLIYLN